MLPTRTERSALGLQHNDHMLTLTGREYQFTGRLVCGRGEYGLVVTAPHALPYLLCGVAAWLGSLRPHRPGMTHALPPGSSRYRAPLEQQLMPAFA